MQITAPPPPHDFVTSHENQLILELLRKTIIILITVDLAISAVRVQKLVENSQILLFCFDG